MFHKTARFFIYVAIASPLIVSGELFFPFIAGKALFFRGSVALGLLFCIGAMVWGELRKDTVMRVIKQPLFITITVFTGLFIITCLTAINPSFAFWSNFERGEGGLQILHYFLFFALLSLLFRSEEDWRKVMGWQVIISSLVALYAMGQAVEWPEWIITLSTTTGALSGTLGNPSYLGGYLMISIFLCLWLALSSSTLFTTSDAEGIALQKPLSVNWIWIHLALFQLIVFFATKNRASFIALGIGIIHILISTFGFRKSKYIIVLVFFIALGTAYGVMTVKEGMGAGKENAGASMGRRVLTWTTAVHGVIEKPLLGWGPENFPFVFDRYYNPKHYGIESWFDRAHNALLEYATGGGIPLVLAYIGMFFVLYWLLIRMQRRTEVWVVFMALPVMYLIYGLVLFETLPLYLVLFLIFAFSLHYTNNFELIKDTNAARAPLPIAPALFAKSALLIALSLYFTLYLPLQKNRLMLAALKTDNKTDQQIFSDYERALSFYAPIGQQEAVQNLFEFTDDYIYFLAEETPDPLRAQKIRLAMDINKKWRRKTNIMDIGVKSRYAYAKLLIAAAHETHDTRYAQEAHALVNEGALRAPARIEFVKLAMELALMEENSTAYYRAKEKGERLRPDLEW